MKPIHWLNLFGVGLAAGLLTFLSMQWAITSYVEPTCKGYAESKGMAYVGYIPQDPGQDVGPSNLSRDGNCQLQGDDGAIQTVSVVAASGPDHGAPFLVHFALAWHFVFIASFIGVAFVLAVILRVIAPKAPATPDTGNSS